MKVNNLLLLTTVIFVLLSHELFSQESVKIHNIKFRADEVTGQNKFLNGTQFYYTAIPNQLVSQRNDEYFYTLGSFRPNYKKNETLDLFNLSLQNDNFPILDAIDFRFYKSLGLSLVESNHPEIISNPKYQVLKAYIIDSVNVSLSEKKRILFASPKAVKDLVLLSRYEIISNPFTVDKKKISQITANLVAQLDTIKVSTNAEVQAKVKVYLSSLSDEATTVEGYYIDARLHGGYISMIDDYLRNISSKQLGLDQFANRLKIYIASKNAAANTALVAIRLEGSYNKTKISARSISADLSGKLSIPEADALKIAARVNVAFTNSEEMTFKSKFNNTFVIRYFTSSIIDEIALKNLKQ